MINAHFVSHFFKHYWSATRIDVLHSPFVFDLYNSCIARQGVPPATPEIEKLRKAALHNDSLVTQTDLGASGQKKRVRKKTVRFFARTHAKPVRLARIIHRMVHHYAYTRIIELGTSLGFTSAYISTALPPEGQLITIEGAEEIAAVARLHFNKLGCSERINLLTGNFDEVLPGVLAKQERVDLGFIDGNHTYEATMNYFNQFLAKVHNGSVLVFDDIYWSRGMTRAWEEIKAHPEVRVTVDLFFIGLVFFRKEQAVEHFRLRVW